MNKTLRVNTYLQVAVFAIATIASSCATKKQTADRTVTLKTTATPSGSTATATIGSGKKEGIKKFSDLVGKTKADAGLFNTYKIDGKYYFEIPDSLLTREMLVVTRFVKTPTGLKSFGQQYGGEEVTTRFGNGNATINKFLYVCQATR
jgi:hypothetical protein